MPIITIYQGASGSGQELAERVASDLGYRCVSREILVETSKRYGIPEAQLNDILEKEHQWWKVWLKSLEPYEIAMQAGFCEVAQGGNLVYHGHLAHELLPGVRHVLKVLLTAPMETRIEQVQARHKLNETAARRYIEAVDKARTRRLMALFGTDWRDPSRYDLVLNMGKMSLEVAKRLVLEAARSEDYQPTAASEQAFQDITMTVRAQAALVMSLKVKNFSPIVRAKNGQVHVSGVLPLSGSEQDIIKLIETIPGVKNVVMDFISPYQDELHE
jgi:cytidylate kinase